MLQNLKYRAAMMPLFFYQKYKYQIENDYTK